MIYGAVHIFSPLAHIINLPLFHGIVSGYSSKNATVLPLNKKGDRTKKENYRPISILSTVSKILEKAVFS
ncbi:hypothetical protein HOLleu_30656 [Holothuria leucospilota]|uniref:Uncharacterized protein n=1 Tax=Holothuria leucospilota TaxID=206669 RepID=A0A9Q1BKU8_HOLLE|nr:hypothetical protein HOLleu_30656 [Holothuria leucospilota]